MSGRVIKNDEEYERARVALLDMAARLDDPLKDMDPEERRKMHWKYDRTAELMKLYSRGRDVERDPSLKEQYDAAGWDYQDFSEPVKAVQPKPQTNTQGKPKHAPERPPEPQKQQTKVSSWLDD
ncbi:hypothetical protein MKY59_20825 [Paenibacillus sp. FSL W8-0426]|uniref:hypothetical protein n=1 Tax=Paenibacillus sp. FSL W8-0426 TaxID=2921714 RepID=UPI0030D8F7EF